MDCGFEQATWPVRPVKLFAFFSEVGPKGPAGAGKENWRPFMRHHPWLARLLDGAGLPDHGRPLVGAASQIDGVPVQVIELTGSPGDVVVTHLHVFHARSPNTGPV